MELHVGCSRPVLYQCKATFNTPSINNITCVEAAAELADCIAEQASIKLASVFGASAPAETWHTASAYQAVSVDIVLA